MTWTLDCGLFFNRFIITVVVYLHYSMIIIIFHFSQTIGALVADSPADSPLIAKMVLKFRRRASSVAGDSNDDLILGIGRELANRQPKSQKLAN